MKTQKHINIAVTLFLFFFLFFFAGSYANKSDANISVIDDAGGTVSIDKPARRIISLAPHVTELLFAAGAGQYVVGVVNYSDYPPAALKIKNIGSHTNFDMEMILALKPDLIVAWKSGNSDEKLKKLSALGMNIFVSEPRKLQDIASNIERLGRLTDTQETASRASKEFDQTYKILKEKYAGTRKVTLFYQIWNQPVMTINGKHLISDVIRLCGGQNVFADLSTLAPKLDIEAVIAADPEAIVANGIGNKRPEWLDRWRKWPHLKAIKNEHLSFIEADIMSRHTPRILLGAKQLCDILDGVRRVP
ncbi:MAG: cobalamin-binding protein [Gammaproteobacteria bacterium]|nr:cobalamin-binding protein [Gammaproteobacteria bacterium]